MAFSLALFFLACSPGVASRVQKEVEIENSTVLRDDVTVRSVAPFRPFVQASIYKMQAATMFQCPDGHGISGEAECQTAYNSAAFTDGLTNTRGMQRGSWDGVPVGCSVQYQNGAYDQAPHWNSRLSSSNSRLGEFRLLCHQDQQAGLSDFSRWGQGCTVWLGVHTSGDCYYHGQQIPLEIGYYQIHESACWFMNDLMGWVSCSKFPGGSSVGSTTKGCFPSFVRDVCKVLHCPSGYSSTVSKADLAKRGYSSDLWLQADSCIKE